jgi:TetR/AcrR family transcriptional regulator, cholesterol catabolism regulator
MPKTRRELDRETKEAEILEAAERQLRNGGYEGLSIAAIARELGVAQNAVYWYFPSKDHLFVAALERMLRTIVAGKPRSRALEGKVLYFAEQLQQLAEVRAAMYERARKSKVVAEFVRNLDLTWRRMLAGALVSHVAEDELPITVDTLIATIQGALLQGLTASERKRVIGFALRRLTAG